MDFFSKLFKRKDPFETELRAAVGRLVAYEATLQKEIKRWQNLPQQRAVEIERTRDECRRKLTLLYNWALLDLLDTFYKQAVLLMKRAWLRSLIDAAVLQALNEQVSHSVGWRKQLTLIADARAGQLATAAGAGTPGAAAAAAGCDPETIDAFERQFQADGRLPVDLPTFMRSPVDVLRDSQSVRRLQKRIGKINERLRDIDADIQRMRPSLRSQTKEERQAVLERLIGFEHEIEERARTAEAAASDIVASVTETLSTVPDVKELVASVYPFLDKLYPPPLATAPVPATPAVEGAADAGSAAAAAAPAAEGAAAGSGASASPAAAGTAGASATGPAASPRLGGMAGKTSGPRLRPIKQPKAPFPLHPCAPWLPLLLAAQGDHILALATTKGPSELESATHPPVLTAMNPHMATHGTGADGTGSAPRPIGGVSSSSTTTRAGDASAAPAPAASTAAAAAAAPTSPVLQSARATSASAPSGGTGTSTSSGGAAAVSSTAAAVGAARPGVPSALFVAGARSSAPAAAASAIFGGAGGGNSGWTSGGPYTSSVPSSSAAFAASASRSMLGSGGGGAGGAAGGSGASVTTASSLLRRSMKTPPTAAAASGTPPVPPSTSPAGARGSSVSAIGAGGGAGGGGGVPAGDAAYSPSLASSTGMGSSLADAAGIPTGTGSGSPGSPTFATPSSAPASGVASGGIAGSVATRGSRSGSAHSMGLPSPLARGDSAASGLQLPVGEGGGGLDRQESIQSSDDASSVASGATAGTAAAGSRAATASPPYLPPASGTLALGDRHQSLADVLGRTTSTHLPPVSENEATGDGGGALSTPTPLAAVAAETVAAAEAAAAAAAVAAAAGGSAAAAVPLGLPPDIQRYSASAAGGTPAAPQAPLPSPPLGGMAHHHPSSSSATSFHAPAGQTVSFQALFAREEPATILLAFYAYGIVLTPPVATQAVALALRRVYRSVGNAIPSAILLSPVSSLPPAFAAAAAGGGGDADAVTGVASRPGASRTGTPVLTAMTAASAGSSLTAPSGIPPIAASALASSFESAASASAWRTSRGGSFSTFLPSTPVASGMGMAVPGAGGAPVPTVAAAVAGKLNAALFASAKEVLASARRLHSSLAQRNQLTRERLTHQRDFHRTVADQRTREGRLFQRWCQRILALSLDGDYAYDMTRFLSFDPGPAFAERTRVQMRIGLPVMAAAYDTGYGGGGIASPLSGLLPPAAVVDASGSGGAGGGGIMSPDGVAYDRLRSPPTGKYTVVGGSATPGEDAAAAAAAAAAAVSPPPPGGAAKRRQTMMPGAASGASSALAAPTPGGGAADPAPLQPPINPAVTAVPTPKTIAVFLKHFTTEIFREYELYEALVKKDTGGRGVYPTATREAALEAMRMLRVYVDRMIHPRLHALLFTGIDLINPDGSIPDPAVYGCAPSPPVAAAAHRFDDPASGGGGDGSTPGGAFSPDGTGEGGGGGAGGDGITVPLPIRPFGSAADTMYRRDCIWAKRLPGVALLSASDMGVASAFMEPLESDVLLVPIPNARAPPVAGALASGSSSPLLGATPLQSPSRAGRPGGGASSSAGGGGAAAASAQTLHWRYTYEPFSIPAQLLACMDAVTTPSIMMEYLTGAVEAVIAEGQARAKAAAVRVAKEQRAQKRRERERLRRLLQQQQQAAAAAIPGADGASVAAPGTLAADGAATPSSAAAAPTSTVAAAALGPADEYDDDDEELVVKPPAPIAADDLIPLLNYTCSRSPWRRPHACLSFIANYGIPPSGATGKEGFMITMVQSCVQWICTLSAKEAERMKKRVQGTGTSGGAGGPAAAAAPAAAGGSGGGKTAPPPPMRDTAASTGVAAPAHLPPGAPPTAAAPTTPQRPPAPGGTGTGGDTLTPVLTKEASLRHSWARGSMLVPRGATGNPISGALAAAADGASDGTTVGGGGGERRGRFSSAAAMLTGGTGTLQQDAAGDDGDAAAAAAAAGMASDGGAPERKTPPPPPPRMVVDPLSRSVVHLDASAGGYIHQHRGGRHNQPRAHSFSGAIPMGSSAHADAAAHPLAGSALAAAAVAEEEAPEGVTPLPSLAIPDAADSAGSSSAVVGDPAAAAAAAAAAAVDRRLDREYAALGDPTGDISTATAMLAAMMTITDNGSGMMMGDDVAPTGAHHIQSSPAGPAAAAAAARFRGDSVTTGGPGGSARGSASGDGARASPTSGGATPLASDGVSVHSAATGATSSSASLLHKADRDAVLLAAGAGTGGAAFVTVATSTGSAVGVHHRSGAAAAASEAAGETAGMQLLLAAGSSGSDSGSGSSSSSSAAAVAASGATTPSKAHKHMRVRGYSPVVKTATGTGHSGGAAGALAPLSVTARSPPSTRAGAAAAASAAASSRRVSSPATLMHHSMVSTSLLYDQAEAAAAAAAAQHQPHAYTGPGHHDHGAAAGGAAAGDAAAAPASAVAPAAAVVEPAPVGGAGTAAAAADGVTLEAAFDASMPVSATAVAAAAAISAAAASAAITAAVSAAGGATDEEMEDAMAYGTGRGYTYNAADEPAGDDDDDGADAEELDQYERLAAADDFDGSGVSQGKEDAQLQSLRLLLDDTERLESALRMFM